MNELDRIIAAARSSIDAGGPSALATILATEGSSFRRAGTRLWIGGDRRVGAISGGCLENDLAERARGVVSSEAAILVPYDSAADGDVLWGTASGCGGLLQILLEPMTHEILGDLEWVQRELAARRTAPLVTEWDGTRVRRRRGLCASDLAQPGDGVIRLAEAHLPPIALTLFGPGDDAHATARMGRELGWRVLHLATTPSGDHALSKGQVLHDARAAVLLMTHNFHRDAELLGKIAPTGVGYVGILGPRRRTERLLAEEGMPSRGLDALHAPPGLDIGGETPEEIALSLLAEIQGHFAGRAGGQLRERAAPIHDRAATTAGPPYLAGSEREP